MRFTVAAVQAAPVYLDVFASLAKAEGLIAEAAARGARLVVFPETWLPGYPAWLDVCRDVNLWDAPAVKQVYRRLVENSVVVPGPVTDALSAAARAHGVVLNMSVHERVAAGPGRGTLYNTMLTFDADGRLAHVHRKLMPTYTERLIWGQGDGQSVQAVATAVGRVGGLICWEHWMPPARQRLHESGEDVHIAAWPQVKEMNLVASRHYAFEGRCFVVACGAIMHVRDLPPELEPMPELAAGKPDAMLLRGGSVIIGPDGTVLAGPIFDEEVILTAEIDLARITEEQMTLDVTGHYARPDVFGPGRRQ
ncbi:Nitrilase/cyanide hydratase and apolipoprotein N-acyltransferase [Hymenobacter roseosalivarius DSM 11622]|uniref:Nitrilase/cyanide hydratase and apolipoprotein N-acyltransferase n=1 Tax=Hymenobacter roseosalivarius DSM 11622 TaxID=645990 RepID=A0A1W1W1P6_9BACT|nr:carbon-nitrogen hydrolase family protein [Hymenobacter roseosalivarius]SMB99433.1 Nitrilase/cyanide hydratase and apolipoprotein N-acyltransferase [Hymenobacter roseosalivarius DSM 11622]